MKMDYKFYLFASDCVMEVSLFFFLSFLCNSCTTGLDPEINDKKKKIELPLLNLKQRGAENDNMTYTFT